MRGYKYIIRWGLAQSFLLWVLILTAQVPDIPPYNAKDYPDAQEYAWYQTPALYVGLVIALLGVLYYLRRGRRRAEHRFMGRK